MHDVYVVIRECGWAAWLCVLIGLFALPLGGVALGLARRSPRTAGVLGVVAVVLGLAATGAAILGRETSIAKAWGATSGASLDPAMRDRIRAVGLAEANQCLKVGAVTGGLPLVFGAIGAGLGFSFFRRQEGEKK